MSNKPNLESGELSDEQLDKIAGGGSQFGGGSSSKEHKRIHKKVLNKGPNVQPQAPEERPV